MFKRLIVTVLIIFFLLSLNVYAKESNESITKEDMLEMAEGFENGEFDFDSLKSGDYLSVGKDLISFFINSFLRVFALSTVKICSAVLVSALVSKVCEICDGKIPRDFMKLLEGFLVSFTVFAMLSSVFELYETFCKDMDSLMSTYGALLSEILLISGSVSLFALSSGWLTLIMEVFRKIGFSFLLPILKLCFSVTLASSVALTDGIEKISVFLKKLYVTVSVFIMSILTVILAFQKSLAGSADSLALRGVKFAAANTVPVIGGLVSEAMRNVTSSLSLLKGQSGTVAVICVIALSLMPLSYIMAFKYSLTFGQAFAGFAGAYSAEKILKDSADIINYIIAMVIFICLYFVFFIALFSLSTGSASV